MKIYEVCVEQDCAEAVTMAIALSEKNAYREMQKLMEDYGDAVFVLESETID